MYYRPFSSDYFQLQFLPGNQISRMSLGTTKQQDDFPSVAQQDESWAGDLEWRERQDFFCLFDFKFSSGLVMSLPRQCKWMI